MKIKFSYFQIEYEGLSGRMQFDVNSGSRKYFKLYITEVLRTRELKELAIWDPYVRVKSLRNQAQILEENQRSLENKTLRVASKLVSFSIASDRMNIFCVCHQYSIRITYSWNRICLEFQIPPMITTIISLVFVRIY